MIGYLPLQNGLHDGTESKTKARAMAAASNLYLRARNQARWGRLCSALTGRTCCLLTLAEVKQACTVHGRCYGGTNEAPVHPLLQTSPFNPQNPLNVESAELIQGPYLHSVLRLTEYYILCSSHCQQLFSLSATNGHCLFVIYN